MIVKLQPSVFRDKSAELTTVPGISADSPRASLGVRHLGVTCDAVLLSRCVTCHELCNVFTGLGSAGDWLSPAPGVWRTVAARRPAAAR